MANLATVSEQLVEILLSRDDNWERNVVASTFRVSLSSWPDSIDATMTGLMRSQAGRARDRLRRHIYQQTLEQTSLWMLSEVLSFREQLAITRLMTSQLDQLSTPIILGYVTIVCGFPLLRHSVLRWNIVLLLKASKLDVPKLT